MASIYDLKSRFQDLLRPVLDGLRSLGVTPNALTITALLLSVLVGGVLVLKPIPLVLLLLPVWLFLRMALNALDGMMAREYDMATPLGGMLNELGDVLSDLALYLPLVVFVPDSLVARGAILGFGIGAALTEFCGILPQTIGGRRQYQGPMGKSDRAFFCGALGILGALYPASMNWWGYLFGAANVLLVITCWRRVQHGLAHGASPDNPPDATSQKRNDEDHSRHDENRTSEREENREMAE